MNGALAPKKPIRSTNYQYTGITHTIISITINILIRRKSQRRQMIIQVHNPMSSDVRLGDKLYDIANDMLWHCDDISRNSSSITIDYGERYLVLNSRVLEGWILIRKVDIDA